MAFPGSERECVYASSVAERGTNETESERRGGEREGSFGKGWRSTHEGTLPRSEGRVVFTCTLGVQLPSSGQAKGGQRAVGERRIFGSQKGGDRVGFVEK